MNWYVSELLDALVDAARLFIVVFGFLGACLLMAWIGFLVFA